MEETLTRGTAWRPAPLIGGSVLLHAAALGAVVAAPALWPWAAGAVVANHVLLAAGGLLPRSRMLGPNWTRLPDVPPAAQSIAITLDDGPHPEVTPRVLELLAARGARATFFCIGERAARHPDLAHAIVAAGHAVENHSLTHRHDFALLGPARYAAEIGAAQRALAEVTGSAPRFFRAPAGLRNPFLDAALARLGLRLVSWTRRGFDTLDRDPARVYARLARGLAPRDILVLHDGNAARMANGRPVALEVLPRLLDAVERAGLRSITLRAALA